MFFLLFTLVICIAVQVFGYDDCRIYIKGIVDSEQDALPILLYPEDRAQMLYPNSQGFLIIRYLHYVKLACPGDGNSLKITGQQSARALCCGENIFKIGGEKVNFNELRCAKYPQPSLKENGKCADNFDNYLIGYHIGRSDFLRNFEVCLDTTNHKTIYSYVNINKGISGQQRNVPRSPWRDDLPVSFNSFYFSQRRILTSIAGNRELINEYTQKSYLNRGHLTANLDLVYSHQQRSTFTYYNTAPQWEALNANNWNSLEQSVRYYASNRGVNLEVYTGTYGQSKVKDMQGNFQPLYLTNDKQTKIDVPQYFWKVIYDRSSKKGTAFVGVNEVYALSNEAPPCHDIFNPWTFRWLGNFKYPFDPANIAAGISYICDVNDLRKTIPTIPPLDITEVLS